MKLAKLNLSTLCAVSLVALLALCDTSVYGQSLVENQFPLVSDSTILIRDFVILKPFDRSAEAKTRRARRKELWKPKEVSLYGSGSVLSLVTTPDSSSVDPQSATGSLGVNVVSDVSSWNIYFSLNSRNETLIQSLESFGASVIDPSLTGRAFSLSWSHIYWNRIGLRANTAISLQRWQFKDESTINVAPTALNFGLFYVPIALKNNENSVKLVLSFASNTRWVLGDFTARERTIEDVRLPDAINGFELSADLFINQLNFFLRSRFFPSIPISEDSDELVHIDGLSGTQFEIGVTFSGNLIKIFDQ